MNHVAAPASIPARAAAGESVRATRRTPSAPMPRRRWHRARTSAPSSASRSIAPSGSGRTTKSFSVPCPLTNSTLPRLSAPKTCVRCRTVGCANLHRLQVRRSVVLVTTGLRERKKLRTRRELGTAALRPRRPARARRGHRRADRRGRRGLAADLLQLLLLQGGGGRRRRRRARPGTGRPPRRAPGRRAGDGVAAGRHARVARRDRPAQGVGRPGPARARQPGAPAPPARGPRPDRAQPAGCAAPSAPASPRTTSTRR